MIGRVVCPRFISGFCSRVIPLVVHRQNRSFHGNVPFHTQSSGLAEMAQSVRVLELKQYLQRLGKAVISKKEFFKIANERVQLSESEAQQLLKHFHESATFCNFENDPILNNEVILKPEIILQQIYKNLKPENMQLQMEELKDHILNLHSEIAPLLKQRIELDKKAHKALNTRIWIGLGYLSAQTAFFAKLTWIDYGWDVVEPMTYFVTFTTAVISYIYFTFRKKDYSYEHAMSSWLKKRKALEYSKNNFPIDKLLSLQMDYDRAVQELLQINIHAFGDVEGQKNFEQQMQKIKQLESVKA
jgi:hypothetical protein